MAVGAPTTTSSEIIPTMITKEGPMDERQDVLMAMFTCSFVIPICFATLMLLVNEKTASIITKAIAVTVTAHNVGYFADFC